MEDKQGEVRIVLFGRSITIPDPNPNIQNPNPNIQNPDDDQSSSEPQLPAQIQNPNPNIQNDPNDDRSSSEPQLPVQIQNPNPNTQNPNDDQSSSSGQPRLPEEFRARLALMGADNVTLIFARQLFDSDVRKDLARLAIPRSQINGEFLRNDEEELLKQKNEDGKMKKLRVRVIDPKLNEWSLTLSRWNYHTSKKTGECSWSYALNGGWIDVVNTNGLKVGNEIQVWSFRVNDALGFVINVKDDEISDQASTSTAITSNDNVRDDELSDQTSTTMTIATDNGSRRNGSSDGITLPPSWGRKKRRGSNASTSKN